MLPTLNKAPTIFTTRDSLGVESISTSISSDICPIINTVTPRPFYWAFMCWIYYDFYRSCPKAKKSYDVFDVFLKRQDYYFVLSQLLLENTDRTRLVGTENTQKDINNNKNGFFPFNRTYFLPRFGGMQYFNAGLFTMGYIYLKVEEDGTKHQFPTLTGECEKMALSFEEVIKDTTYFKKYRLTHDPIPRDVLIEYGKKINLGLVNFDKCKEMLRASLFSMRVNNLSKDYALFLSKNYNIMINDNSFAREVLYDYFSPRGYKKDYPDSLKKIIVEWEIVIGRQYFAASLEMMWKYMLFILGNPSKKEDWILSAISNSSFDININDKLSSIIDKCNYDFVTREEIIKTGSSNSKSANYSTNICGGLKVLLSVFNRFDNRPDISGKDMMYLQLGEKVSIFNLITIVKEYKEKSIKDFLVYIIDQWLINKHYDTALEKLYNGRDGFYYEIIDGLYHKKRDFEFQFQQNRFIQLTMVMKDLNMFEGE